MQGNTSGSSQRRRWAPVVGLIILFSAIFLGVLISIPSDNEIRFFIRETLKSEKDMLEELGRDGLSLAYRRHALARQLDSRFSAKVSFLAPPEEPLNTYRLEDFVTATVESVYNSDFINLKVGVDPVSLVQSYIDRFFSGGVIYVVFENFRTFGASATPRYELNVNVFARNRAILGRGERQQRYELVQHLGEFLSQNIYEFGIDCSVSLCSKDLPSGKGSLEVLTKALDALRYGANAGLCDRIVTVRACRERMREELTKLLDTDPDSALPSFALFLLEMSALRDFVVGNGSSDALAATLERVHQNLVRGQSKSKFIAELTEDDDRLQAFLDINELRDLAISSDFLHSYPNFLKGRSLYQSGRSKEAVAYYTRVQEVPPWFRPYYQAYSRYAEVDANPDDLDLLKELILLYESMEGTLTSHVNHAFVGVASARAIERFSERLTSDEVTRFSSLAIKALSRAVDLAPTEQDELGALSARALAYQAIGDFAGAEDDIIGIQRRLPTQVDERYRLVFMGVGRYYMRGGHYQRALEYFELGVSSYPRFLCSILNHGDYAVLQEYGDYDEWRSQVKAKVGEVNC